MKSSTVVLKLMENLPKYSKLYDLDISTIFNPDAISITGSTVSVNKTDHGLVNNELISVVSTKLGNAVDSLVVDGDDNATVTTSYDNDLTVGFQLTVRLESATEPTIDGDYQLEETFDSKTFLISGFTFGGVIPGDIKLIEDRTANINGVKAITYVDADNFTFESDYALDTNLEIIPSTVDIHSKLRISRAATIERLIESYNSCPPKELQIYAVLGGTSINKNKETETDSDMEQGNLNEWEGYLREPFTIYSFDTLGSDGTGGDARDRAVDLRIALYRSILGEPLETNTAAGVNDTVYPTGDDVYQYQKAYYVHEFEFAQQAMLSLQDTTQATTVSVAANAVNFDIVQIDDGTNILISGEVELRD